MKPSLLDSVRGANLKLSTMLLRVRDALAGRHNIGVEDIHAIAEPVSQMAPLVAQAKKMRTVQPELDSELEVYAENLGEMEKVLEQMRFMLIARRANLEAMRGHVETVELWATAWRQTL